MDPTLGQMGVVETEPTAKGRQRVDPELHRFAEDDRGSIGIVHVGVLDDDVPEAKLGDLSRMERSDHLSRHELVQELEPELFPEPRIQVE